MADVFSLKVARRDGTAHFRLEGALQASTARMLQKQLLDELRSDEDVVLDLDGVERVDVTGLQLVLATHAWVTGHARTLRVVATTDNMKRMLAVSGALGHLTPGTDDASAEHPGSSRRR